MSARAETCLGFKALQRV